MTDNPTTTATARPLTEYATKRDKLVGDGETFKASIPHQAAAQTWAIADLAEATREGNDLNAIRNRALAKRIQLATEANEIADRHATAAERCAEAAERQALALERANELAERAVEATVRQTEATVALVREQRITNMLGFYTTKPEAFYENGREVLTKALAAGRD